MSKRKNMTGHIRHVSSYRYHHDMQLECYQLLSPAKNESTDEKLKFSLKFFNLVIIKIGT